MLKNNKNKGAFLAVCALTCASACFFSACTSSNKEATEIVLTQDTEGVGYITAAVEYGEVVQSAKLTCNYTPTEYEDLAFGVEERLIEQVNVKEGDIVSKGDLLASVDVEDLKDSIEELEYQIERQNLELIHNKELRAFDTDRAKTLYAHSRKDEDSKEKHEEELLDIQEQYYNTIQDLEDSIALNQKRLDQYKEELNGGQLVAGISGEVTFVQKSLVDTYSEEDKRVITISNLDSCYFIVDDATYADSFVDGTTVQIVYKADGVETYVDVTPVNREQWDKQMYFKTVNGEIIENGQEGTIYLELGRKNNVLCVPSDAVHEAEDGKFVYVLENELLNMRYVEVGLENTEVTEIISGLEQGETVVLK